MSEIVVTKKDILKHYLSSILVYGVVLFLVSISPLFNQNIQNPYFSYITVLAVYYLLYVVFGYPIFLKLKPESILKSRSVTIINYFVRQFKKDDNPEVKINKFFLTEDEKQAFVILFVKSFFGVIGLNLLCNKYLPSLGYDFEFLKTMFEQGIQGSNFWAGCAQYIEDTYDMWLTLMFTITTFVLTVSYLTESKFFSNKIKYVDTTPLGMLSCLMCYYPLILITNLIFPMNMKEIMPIENFYIRIPIFILVLVANFISMLAILRLGTKSGNLTNRGIVTGFPYNIVRHPDYSMQMFYVVLTSIPVYLMNEVSVWAKIFGTSGIILWILILYIRAITEERNLIKDEKYLEYIKKVKYRFIPKVW